MNDTPYRLALIAVTLIPYDILSKITVLHVFQLQPGITGLVMMVRVEMLSFSDGHSLLIAYMTAH
jgi:hypothetical protein